MANLQPQPALLQPPLNAVVRHNTFASFYNDATKDPCLGQYARIMNRFDPNQANMIQPEVLLDQALGAGGVPQAYLACSATRRGPRIYVLHLPARFTGALDGRTTPWDNNLYAFLGEVTQGTVTTVVFPNTAFNVIEHIRARTTELFCKTSRRSMALKASLPFHRTIHKSRTLLPATLCISRHDTYR